MHGPIPIELRRAIVVLASLKLKTAEIARLQRFLRDISPSELTKLLRNIDAELFTTRDRDSEDEISDGLADSTDVAVIQQVLMLLKGDISMHNHQIVSELSEEFKVDQVTRDMASARFDSRKSLLVWLQYINRLVGPSELLRAATHVRNRHMSRSSTPWSVEGEK